MKCSKIKCLVLLTALLNHAAALGQTPPSSSEDCPDADGKVSVKGFPQLRYRPSDIAKSCRDGIADCFYGDDIRDIDAATIGASNSYLASELIPGKTYQFRLEDDRLDQRLTIFVAIPSTPTTNPCTTGNLTDPTTPCVIDRSVDLTTYQAITGSGSLIVDAGARLASASENVIRIALDGDVVIRAGGSIQGNLEIDARNITVIGDIEADAVSHSLVGSGVGSSGDALPRTNGGEIVRPACGGGGGSHGGGGGHNCTGYYPNGPDVWPYDAASYDDYRAPNLAGGAGGASDWRENPVLGGGGGGSIRLFASGQLALDGRISARGGPGTSGDQAATGGGAGGSVWIKASSVTGLGSINVNGGDTTDTNYGSGGGGGGRIAIHATNANTTGLRLSAHGGRGSAENQRGGAGSIFRNDGSLRILTFDNALTQLSAATSNLDFLGAGGMTHLEIRGGAQVALANTDRGLWQLELASLIIDENSALTSDGTFVDGWDFDAARGEYDGFGNWSHGGAGGAPGRRYTFGTYGDPFLPAFPGDGYRGSESGSGGGRIKLIIADRLRLDGRLSADGTCIDPRIRQTLDYPGACGAGGSIWIEAAAIEGSGLVTTRGGSPLSGTGSGGGGGRIALYYDSMTPAIVTQAQGGRASTDELSGGAGSVFTKVRSGAGRLRYDNGTINGQPSVIRLDSHGSVDLLEVAGNSHLVLVGAPQTLAIAAMRIESGASIDHSGLGKPGGSVNYDSSPYVGYRGNGLGGGSGGVANRSGGGAAHGGRGGDGVNGRGSTIQYGDALFPLTPGSGGGAGGYLGADGGAGGGVVRLSISGDLTLDGAVKALGTDGSRSNFGIPSQAGGGGGSGGSIWIDAARVIGTGTIQADGANSNIGTYVGGAGGGGRIALYTDELREFDRTRISARAGTGTTGAGNGTIEIHPRIGCGESRLAVNAEYDNNNGDDTLSVGDSYMFHFSQAMDPDSIVDNSTDANRMLAPADLIFGAVNRLEWIDSRTLVVKVTDGYTIAGDEFILPSGELRSVSGDTACLPVQLQAQDTVPPRVLHSGMILNDSTATRNNYRIVIQFSESIEALGRLSTVAPNDENQPYFYSFQNSVFDNDTVIYSLSLPRTVDPDSVQVLLTEIEDRAGNDLVPTQFFATNFQRVSPPTILEPAPGVLLQSRALTIPIRGSRALRHRSSYL